MKINETKLTEMISRSVRKALRENASMDVFNCAYGVVQDAIIKIVSTCGISPEEAVAQIEKVLNTFDASDLYDDGDI